ncbi:Gfo/Idh/MocA family protein [Segetibacter koreensis]|uniref:Gfo/Idh/MocA family protein n=1 Tax=Segetibacter koreensis TaxID=398037 RepID=UPI0003726EC2|nr:Gfo/Idh/MocA family oxidoreductase [Segetibacter koreensis]
MKRRMFVKNASVISAATILKPRIVFGTKANSAIRMGIIGCGGRGTSVISTMSKNTNINIIAMADLFDYQLQSGLVKYNDLNKAKGLPEIQTSNMYQGSKAYLKLLENKDVDAVLISSPCYTHPEFMKAALAAGKHVYCEKPVAMDVDGCRQVEQLGKSLNGKLSVAIGFEIRYATPYVEMINRIHNGDIGDIISADLYYFSSAVPLKPYKGVPNDEARIRNHFHFYELSGGILVDQGIHMLDISNWALKAHPVEAMGTGGIKGSLEFGNAWTNYQALYKYPNDVNMSIHSTQVGPAFGDVCARFIGTKGIAEAHYNRGVYITGENKWDSGVVKGEATPEQVATGAFLSSLHDADDNKVKSFIKSIETGNHLNETQQGSESTLTAILGRNAAQTHKKITWDEMRSSNQKIDPKLSLSQFDKK